MLVYGDHSVTCTPRKRLAQIEQQRIELTACPRGIERHAALVSLFIDLAGVAQGVADAPLTEEGDWQSPAETALLDQLVAIARTMLHSWQADGQSDAQVAPIIAPRDLPETISIRQAEGFAHYALYPEAFGEACSRLRLTGPPVVIGIRSIGTALAAVVAAALDTPRLFTVRPRGDPFHRTLHVAPSLAQALLSERDSHFVVVDEGPGLSGSSFGAVADWLEEHGVDRERIAFIASNPTGPGASASERHKQRWTTTQRVIAQMDFAPLIRRWTGASLIEDISGGQWRPLRYASEDEWPAVNPVWERRKFLATSDRGRILVRFAGLGSIGRRKLEIAQALRGWVPQAHGLVHGWLIEEWQDEACPVKPSIDEVGEYLAARRQFAAPAGASLATLALMSRTNVPELLGDWHPDCAPLQSMVQPIRIDGQMGPQEWLRSPGGRLFKADAVDHHAAHDLVGCQDLAWDVAGAIVELSLDPVEAQQLAQCCGSNPALLDFYLRSYCAFRIGAHRLSVQMTAHDPAEAPRHRREADRVQNLLAAYLR